MTASQTNSLTIVTPVYDDEEAASCLFRELAAVVGPEVYVVAVDDGSVRLPLRASSISRAGLDGVVITLKRNVGHQRAIAVGLNYVAECLTSTTKVVVMDSDGEDSPQTIGSLLEPLKIPDVDVVVAERRNRVETLRFRAFYVIYKRIFQALTGRKISFGNFMALKPMAVQRLVSMHELGTHVAGAVLTSKLRIAMCALDRGPRYAGKSRMNFVGLALHGFKALMVFAEDVLVRVGIACAIVAALSVIGSVAAVILKLIGFATPGWFSVALGILLLVFLQTGALTLMTLMLTGVVRSGSLTGWSYRDLILNIAPAQRSSGG
jgi:glycosyltransferase involved in cell wall biosynthesis